MNRLLSRSLAGVVLALGFAGVGLATPTINFANGTNNTELGSSETVGGIAIYGADWNGTSLHSANLWLRNQANDHGLGVCSEGTDCSRGGDWNELSNEANYEGILLDKGAGSANWASLWVSSLDSNGGTGHETGTLLWGNTLSDLLTNYFSFSYGDFGTSVEGDVLSLSQASSFDPTARYVIFVAGTPPCLAGVQTPGCNGINNDYLVYGASLASVPEPPVLGLFGLGLLLLAGLGYRSTRRGEIR